MAGAIVSSLRERRPDCQIVFTFFSPSAERIAPHVGADITAYLPWDVRRDLRHAITALRPDVVAFIRTEVWPTLLQEAQRAGARVALVNAPLGARSSRIRPFARRLLGRTYAQLDAVGAVSDGDAERFARLRVPRDRVAVTGDARFDQVSQRIAGLDRNATLLQTVRQGPPAVVAGSTWPEDESRLIAAWSRIRDRGARLIIAPHEPRSAHIARLEAALDSARIPHARIDHAAENGTHALIVDRTGILADLYAAARVAYVGGGFGQHGLHSVIEPAALGVPVIFGPHHGNAIEAKDLVRAGGGFVVRSEAELAERLASLLDDPVAGRAAGDWVRSKCGGAGRNAALVLALLDGSETSGRRRGQ